MSHESGVGKTEWGRRRWGNAARMEPRPDGGKMARQDVAPRQEAEWIGMGVVGPDCRAGRRTEKSPAKSAKFAKGKRKGLMSQEYE